MNVALRSIELFAGGGGLALGLESVGIRTVCFVEIEAYAAAVLAARMGEGRLAPAPIWSDVCTFDGRRWRGVVDLIAGGFPCQDISTAGKGAGIVNGERSGLWREFARIVGEVGPNYVFVENVAALLGRGLDVVLGDLASLGFDAEWGVFRASDVGAPHRRERIFILAHATQRGGGFGSTRFSGHGEPKGENRGCGGDVAHTRRERGERRGKPGDMEGAAAAARGEGLQRERRGRAAGDCGPGGVADAWSERLEGHGDAGPAPGAAGRGGGAEVADSDERGREGEWDAERARLRRASGDLADGRGGLRWRHEWPPGPQDADGWRAHLKRWPGTEPALRRGADGLASQVDRLRVLGNGVCPPQAALAWRVLWDRLHGG